MSHFAWAWVFFVVCLVLWVANLISYLVHRRPGDRYLHHASSWIHSGAVFSSTVSLVVITVRTWG